MTTIELPEAEAQVASIVSNLRWYAHTEDSDSINAQRMRANELYVTSRQLETLVWDVQLLNPESRLFFTVGDEPVVTTMLNRGAYDMYSTSYHTIGDKIGPRDSLAFDDANRWQTRQEFPQGREVLLRSGLLYLSASGLAKALVANGTLSIVEANQAKAAARRH